MPTSPKGAKRQSAGSGAPAYDVSAIAGWLVDGARSASKSEDVLTEMCVRLSACGLPLWRVAVYVNTLHPQILARRFLWRPGANAGVDEAPFAFATNVGYRDSPIVRIRTTGEAIRRTLADPHCPMDFEVLKELREEGVTDYLAAPLRFTNGEIHSASFTTRQAGGFSQAQIDALEAILPPLARVAEVRALRRTAVNLLDAYVGHDAGERILAGRIRRGDTETIRAAIWLSDMRGFTRLADTIAPQALIERLNLFFDCLVPAIEAEGGEVLKFMGDGLLAIFRFADETGVDVACARALRAGRQAQAAIEALPATSDDENQARLRFGLALHLGEALYGNIGGGGRLDFTCIGPAINMAARLEKIASKLGRVIVASTAFAQRLPDDFTALGDFELAGFRSAQTVYGLREDGAGA
ncbi:adenylate/guanylate cyclase domain-containing protein [Methylocapsa sp. S129]|uniref:adenylate/guanylate cyclase domain-containing protein n=1 Tax=Methylocapsa sp. S129 TaxID=1641869 RepID=UPI00131CB74B|nr:adenylate/guanylate cyclase domain-containing protein [Methylocapsa sp. S129]